MTSQDTQSNDLPVIAMIVAVGANGVIGADNDLPWRLKADMRHFVEATRGKPVVMGRRTWESFPKRPLPGRPNLVITRNTGFQAPGARVMPSLGSALAVATGLAQQSHQKEIMIIGGGMIYEAALPLANRIYLTEVDAAPDGDTRFPELEPANWREIASRRVEADADNDHGFTLRTLERVAQQGQF